MTKHPPHRPGAVRVIVEIDGDERCMVADIPVAYLDEWLTTMAGLIHVPIAHDESGALQVREIFRVAAKGDQPLMVCLCAIWISLYGPGSVPGLGLSLDDLREAAGNGTLTIEVSADRCRWRYQLTSSAGRQGGRRDVPGLDFVTVGTA